MGHLHRKLCCALQMDGVATLLAPLFLSACVIDAQVPDDTAGSNGVGYTLELHEFRSTVFRNTRALRVLLPPGYHEESAANRTYTVLYANDGISIARESSINLGGVAARLVADGEIPPLVIVGVDNGASTDETTDPLADRAREFLPYPDVGPFANEAPIPPNGEIGDLYPDFIVDEVVPFIEARYRVGTARADRAVGGYSYGGSAALNTVLRRPGEFGYLMLESTPLWLGYDGEFMRDVEKAETWPARVYIAAGTNEVEDPEAMNAASSLQSALVAAIRRRSGASCVMQFVDEGANHDQIAWNRRAARALVFLFGDHDACRPSVDPARPDDQHG